MEAAGGFDLKFTGTVDSDSESGMQRRESAGCRTQAKLRGLRRMGLLTCVLQCSSAAAWKLSFNLKSRNLSVALLGARGSGAAAAERTQRRRIEALFTPRGANGTPPPSATVHDARDDTCPSLRRY